MINGSAFIGLADLSISAKTKNEIKEKLIELSSKPNLVRILTKDNDGNLDTLTGFLSYTPHYPDMFSFYEERKKNKEVFPKNVIKLSVMKTP